MLDPCNTDPGAVDGRLFQIPVHEQEVPHTSYAEILGALDAKVQGKTEAHKSSAVLCQGAASANELQWRDCQRFAPNCDILPPMPDRHPVGTISSP